MLVSRSAMGTVRVSLRAIQAGVSIPLDERTRIVVVPDAAMVSLRGRACDARKCFILPRALPQLRAMFEFALRMQARRGLVVGHVNGSAENPEELSAQRAEVIRAWLEGDPEPWLKHYEDAVPQEQRWGVREDRLLLETVQSGTSDDTDTEDQDQPDPVKQFQALHGLVVDGIVGPNTRKKLVEEYFALSRQARLRDAEDESGPAPFETELTTHAAAANFDLEDVRAARAERDEEQKANGDTPPSPTPREEEDTRDVNAAATTEDAERVELFLFFADAPIDPAPASADGPEYAEWVRQAELFQDFIVGEGQSRGPRLELRLIDKTGTVPLARHEYEITGPEIFTGTTDDRGGLEHEDVLPGNYELTLTLVFFGDPEKNEPRDKIVDRYSTSLVGLAKDDPAQVRLLGALPRCRLAQLKGLLFDTNKAFLLPSAIPDLKKIRKIYEQHDPSELLVVGHTDTTGQPSTNDPLSLDRATAALAYLEDDVETWEKFYAPSVKESQRWGETEDEHMRGALTAEGIPGVSTMDRKTLIQQYMGLDGVELDAGEFEIAATAHGCGENFPLNDAGDDLDEASEDDKEDAQDRRVEFFFFDTEFGIVPKPQGENSPKGSKQYPAWRELSKETIELEAGGKLPVFHDLVVPLRLNRDRDTGGVRGFELIGKGGFSKRIFLGDPEVDEQSDAGIALFNFAALEADSYELFSLTGELRHRVARGLVVDENGISSRGAPLPATSDFTEAQEAEAEEAEQDELLDDVEEPLC